MSDLESGPVFNSPPWQPGTRLAVAIIITLLVGVVFYLLRGLFTAIALAFLLAYMLHPVVTWLSGKLHISRGLSALIIFFLLLLMVVGGTTGLGVAFTQRIIDLAAYLGEIAESLPTQIENLQQLQLQLGPWSLDLSSTNLTPLLTDLAGAVSPLLAQAGSLLGSVALAAASAVSGFLLVMVIGYYLVVDYPKLKPALLRSVPAPYRGDVDFLIREMNRVWRAFLRGQVILGLIMGVGVALIMTILGINFPLVIGLISGVLELVPMFGPFVSGLVAVLVALFQPENPWGLTPLGFALLVLVVFMVIQQVENAVLVPRVIGVSLNLPPLAVLLSVLAGGVLAGVVGILLASPIVATLRLCGGYVYAKIVDYNVTPAPVVEPRPVTRRLAPAGKRLLAALARVRDRLRDRGGPIDE